MTSNPRAGITHHVVLHIDTLNRVGVIVTPGTYRVTKAPNMIPRMAVGDPRGLDYSRWWSFVQDDFSGGAGQYRWDKDYGNNRFAESLFMDIGLPGQQAAGDIGGDRSFQDFQAARVIADPVRLAGSLAPAAEPVQTTALSPLPILMTATYPAFVFLYSNRPMFVHNQFAASYTGYDANYWEGSPVVVRSPGSANVNDMPWRGSPSDYLKGKWAVTATQIASAAILAAVAHSTMLVVSAGSQGLRVFGSSNGIAAATWYTPAYNTVADLVTTFDDRIWRTVNNKLSYLDPATGGWGTYQDIGESTYNVKNTVNLNGKILFGKANGLWAYDAGRIYPIQQWEHSIDPSNFSLMEVLRGAVYFNIGQEIYRYGQAGTVEKLDFPILSGTVIGGEVTDSELYVLEYSERFYTRIWVYNPETGGAHEWLRSKDITTPPEARKPFGPTSLNAAAGALWLSPMYMTTTGRSHWGAIAAVNKLLPVGAQLTPNIHKGGRSYAITSELTMGYPDLTKYWDSLEVDYNLRSTLDGIKVYYLPQISYVNVVAAVLDGDVGGAGWNGVPNTASGNPGPGATGLGDLTPRTTDGLAGPTAPAYTYGTTGTNPSIVIGFRQKVGSVFIDAETLVIGLGADYGVLINSTNFQWKYCNGVDFSNVLVTTQTPVNRQAGSASFASLHGPTLMSWTIPPNWELATINGISAYWIYLEQQNPTSQISVRLYEVSVPNDISLRSTNDLEKQEWRLLGEVNKLKNLDKLNFPNDIISRTMMFKFETVSGGYSRPEILKYKVRYMPVGPDSNLLRVSMAVNAINNIRLLDGSIENNAQGIAATVFSLVGANKPYVVELPWPPPVGHTRRARVLLSEPGVQIPVMTFDNTLGALAAAPEATIPIIIEEL